MATLPVILDLARHPERIHPTRTDLVFVAMAMEMCSPRTKPGKRLQLLQAIFRLMKRVELSETLSPKLAEVWMENVFAIFFKADPRTRDMHRVQAFRLLFDVETWAYSHDLDEPADHSPRAVDCAPPVSGSVTGPGHRSQNRPKFCAGRIRVSLPGRFTVTKMATMAGHFRPILTGDRHKSIFTDSEGVAVPEMLWT